MPWDPEQYLKFSEERMTPFTDLLSIIRVRYGLSVLDLGCGTGELTRRLADHFQGSSVTGLDNSPHMLEKARNEERSGLTFVVGEIGRVEGAWDLVFSHAAIHWVDDHLSLIPNLMSLVKPGGQLAVQLPSNHRHPAHALIVDTAREDPFRSALRGWVRHSPVLEPDRYAELLYQCGGTGITVYEKVYGHIMPDADAIAEWTAGTTLVPYFERLPKELHEPFMERYRSRLREVWPDCPVFYTFRRILFSATKP